MRKLKIFSIFAVVLAAIGLVACNKSDVVGVTDSSVRSKAPISKNIRYFENFDQVLEEIDKTISMSFEQLVEYEKSIGFNSFGKLADMAYEEVAKYQDEYKDVEEVRVAIAKYPEYLQLTQDEKEDYTVETKLPRRITKYIINEEKMYQVKDTLVKILENATVQASVDKYKELLSINEKNVLEFLNDKDIKVALDPYYGFGEDNWYHCFPTGWLNHLNKVKINEDVKTIKVGNYNRDHKLTVYVMIQFINYTEEKLSYMFEGRRKGIANKVYWGYFPDVKFDLTVTIAQSSGISTQVQDHPCLPVYNKNGIASGHNSKYQHIGYFWSNYNGWEFSNLNYTCNVFLKTRGYAYFSSYPSVYVPFNFN